MPELDVVGSGPIAFTTKDGSFKLIPLSYFYFDANKKLQSTWPEYNTYKDELGLWLNYLVNTGALKPGATPPPKQAMVIQAQDAGAAGNNIKVTFKNIVVDPDADKTTFDATITETDTYEGLTPDSIKAVLDAKPGLVHIKDGEPPSLPKEGTYTLTQGAKNKMAFAKVDGTDSNPTAFFVEAKKKGKGGNRMKVIISEVNSEAKTFTLTAVWTQDVPGIRRVDLPDTLAPPDEGPEDTAGTPYEIKVSKPNISASNPGGDPYEVPAPGTVILSGGAEKMEAKYASGTIFTS